MNEVAVFWIVIPYTDVVGYQHAGLAISIFRMKCMVPESGPRFKSREYKREQRYVWANRKVDEACLVCISAPPTPWSTSWTMHFTVMMEAARTTETLVPTTTLHSITTQETLIYFITAVKTYNLAFKIKSLNRHNYIRTLYYEAEYSGS
jgi:hypothetical protein